jgi:DNA-binding transcriptional LysR family regulator
MSRTQNKLKGLSLDRLETLAAIVREGGIMRAAEFEATRQSQFSRQVAELEKWFGVKLMDRSVSPNVATEEARVIARLTEGFLRELNQVREKAEGGRSTVVIGAGERMIRGYLIPWSSKANLMEYRMVYRNLTSRSIQTELLGKRVDIGVLRGDECPAGFESRKLPPMRMSFVAPKKVAAKIRSWSQLAEFPMVGLEGGGRFSQWVLDKISKENVSLDMAVECSTWTQVIDVMNAFEMAGFVPQDLLEQLGAGFATVPLPGISAYTDDYSVVWDAGQAKARPDLLELVKRLVRKA